jgi:dihydroorotase-like cyclic amidohydrolase
MGDLMERMADLLITGGTVVNETGRFAADVAVKDGVIAFIGHPSLAPAAREVIDARGRYVIPGAIDVHVHIREPGMTHKEDWTTGTRAAAAGGVTTVFDMPNTDPPTWDLEALAIKREAAERQAHVNFGLYGLVDERKLDSLEPLMDAGERRCGAGSLRGAGGARASLHHPRRELAHALLAREPDEGRRAHGRLRPLVRAGRYRGAGEPQPLHRAERVDGGAHPHRA